MALRFPKPLYDDLFDSYNTEPESVHECRFLYKKHPISINTCAVRMGEALAIANGFVDTRQDIEELTTHGGNGHGYLFGKYGYHANLCPHGITRGARDLGDFLREQWGKPSYQFKAPGAPPSNIMGRIGVMVFVKLPTFAGQGHVDLWDSDGAVGHAHWDARDIWFWELL